MQKDLAFSTVAMLNLFNAIDLITTCIALERGTFQELNPVILGLYRTSPILMILFKLSMVVAISVLLLKLRSANVGKVLYKGVYLGLFIGILISATVLGYVSVHNVILLMSV
ncbi:hypothetical protein DRP05_10340 [Archaeoglobales archaeon]|nr:MAG: hypothetical protein DRP05_10340 [Archaeoglobales archaeon]